MSSSKATSNSVTKPAKKHPFLDLMISIVAPSLILTKLSDGEHLGPVVGLIVALAFPIVYFFVELAWERRTNFISILGMVSILLTGGIGLLALDPHWVAVKEAAVPAIIGLVVLGTLKSRFSLVRKIIYNDSIIDTTRVTAALEERGNQSKFDQLLVKTSYLLAASFFLSSFLNYFLAKMLVVTDPSIDQVAFNEQIGQMTAWSYPVIVLPSTIVLGSTLWLLLRGIQRLTGLTFEDIFHAGKELSEKK